MSCNNKTVKFPTGQPGTCLPGYGNVYLLGATDLGTMDVLPCTSHSNTIIAVSVGSQLKATLPAGKYVVEFVGVFDTTTHKLRRTYHYNFKRNIGGVMTLIPGCKKEATCTLGSTSSRLALHMKSDIFELTSQDTIYFTHGVLGSTGETTLFGRLYYVQIVIYKL